ncbi:hypothetical protein D9613_012853 [Agrocybe pediades]|uniref:XPG-I domain-containing protein n=1 Tax=Agrocybe pediades TaxID=84607 RepID=A0A8H4QV36_9AGAR|nr:hypothetical protein D9613_012853 [Agrocybe pediades]
MLNSLGMIDAVVTDDSDAVVFGANIIYKSIPREDREFDDQVNCYDAKKAKSEINFSRGDALLVALLSGGDYHKGIERCGYKIAHDLAKCGFGKRLLQEYSASQDRDELARFLSEWRVQLRLELCSNSEGNLKYHFPSVAQNIPDTFPDLNIVELYVNPLTSLTAGSPPILPDQNQWLIKEIPDIVKFCVLHLGWNTLAKLRTHFKSKLYEAIFLRMIYSPLAIYDPSTRNPAPQT